MLDDAANSLEGRILKNKWTVIKKIDATPGATGGFFSVCYIVSDGTNEAFLKALNFKAFFQMFPGRSIIDVINEQTNAFKYEKELLLRCKNNRLSKVSVIIDEGEEIITEATIPNVPYLIFEMASGDVRSHIRFSKDLELAWKLKSLHNVVVGLNQLHRVDIAHQDLKPSNVLLYDEGIISKIGDLGRSLCYDIQAPHDEGDGSFPGDINYSPPEYLYNYIEPDYNKRVKATDLYLYGSLVVFYFTGNNMTALIGKNIDPQFRWNNWRGTFHDVKDYLVDGFYKAIKEFQNSIENKEIAKELAILVEYCCFPYPDGRGHPQAFTKSVNQYEFHRFITKMDVLSRKAKYLS